MDRILGFTAFAAIAFFFLGAVAYASGPERVQPDELKALLEGKEVVLIDVRTPEEHQESHIPGSVLMPLDTLEGVKSLPTGGRIVLYCRSGKRSQTALKVLEGKGFTGLVDLDGGINAWIRSGGEVISGAVR